MTAAKTEESADTSPRICECDGQLVSFEEDGVYCCKGGRKKAAS